MLAIRMQRTGRKGHAHFRLIVQDAKLNPSSGRVVAAIGNYDPHSKAVTIDKDKAGYYLKHGAQPSPRLVVLLKKEGVKMPSWVIAPEKMQKKTRHPEKLRRNQPKQAAVSEAAPAEKAEPAATPTEPVENPTETNETTETTVSSTEPVETSTESNEKTETTAAPAETNDVKAAEEES